MTRIALIPTSRARLLSVPTGSAWLPCRCAASWRRRVAAHELASADVRHEFPRLHAGALRSSGCQVRKGRSAGVLSRTIGDGLLTAEQDTHRQQKRYLTPVFYKERIQSYAEIVAEETKQLADKLQDGVPVAIHDAMMQLTLGIIARTMFKTELGQDKAELAAAVDVTISIRPARFFRRLSSL